MCSTAAANFGLNCIVSWFRFKFGLQSAVIEILKQVVLNTVCHVSTLREHARHRIKMAENSQFPTYFFPHLRTFINANANHLIKCRRIYYCFHSALYVHSQKSETY